MRSLNPEDPLISTKDSPINLLYAENNISNNLQYLLHKGANVWVNCASSSPCLTCTKGCLSCSDSPSNCLSCDTNHKYYLNGSKCVFCNASDSYFF